MLFDAPAQWFHFAFASSAFCILCCIDLRRGLIPNCCVIAIATLGLLALITHRNFEPLLTSLVLGVGSYLLRHLFFKVTNRHGLGMGDVKLMATCGLWFPLTFIPTFLIVSGVSGLLTALAWNAFKKNNSKQQGYWQERFPFAPALFIAWLITTTL